MAFPWQEPFTGSDGAALPNFTTVIGSFDIRSNACAPASFATDCSAWYSKTFDNTAYGPDYYVQAKITKAPTAGNTVGIFLRGQQNSTVMSFYLALVRTGTPDNLEIWRNVDNTFTQLGADITTPTWVDGDTLRLEVSGNTLTLKVNGVAQGTTRTDSTFQYVSGIAGIRIVSSSNAARVDDFEVGFLDSTKNLIFANASPLKTTCRFAAGISEAGTIKVEYSPNSDMSSSTTTSGIAVTSTTDYTATFNISNLTPNTQYYYRILIDDVVKEVTPWRKFKTLQNPGASIVKFAFGSCTKSALHGPSTYTDGTFSSIITRAPDFWMNLGDDYYVDPNASASLNATGANNTVANKRFFARTHQQRGTSTFQKFLATRDHATFKILDDHEIVNDFDDGTSDAEYTTGKQVYLEYSGRGNPDPVTANELYYTFDTGDVGFFVLDTRSFRSLNSATDDASKTIMGATQKTALKNWLLSYKNTYAVKVIVSPTHTGASGQTGNDSWGVGFTTELTEIRNYIVSNTIKGVFFISGDQHWAGFDKVVSTYNFYDALASPYSQANITAPATNSHLLFSSSAGLCYCLVTIDTVAHPFTVKFEFINASNTVINTQNLADTDLNWSGSEWPLPITLTPGSAMLLGAGL